MIRKKQLITILSVAALMVILLLMDPKALVKPKEDRQHATADAEMPATPALTVGQVSDIAKKELGSGDRNAISQLEEQLGSAPDAGKAALRAQLAEKWAGLNKMGPAAFYYEAIAGTADTYKAWVEAGDAFTSAYQEMTDETPVRPAYVAKATEAYKKALEKDSTGIDARTGLGVAYVNGSGAPMQGIQLLREVVQQDPKNVKANMNLGLFSIKSGQFDKAVERFKTVLSVQETPETWFYLASSYESLGKKAEAIAAYQNSKKLAADPGLSRYVDQRVSELSK